MLPMRLGWLFVALGLVGVAISGACSSSPPVGPSAVTDGATAARDGDGHAGLELTAFPHSESRDVDILFVVDDAPGSGPLQAKLVAGVADFVSVLAALPGGLPNVHLAVVSSDLGAGRFSADDVPGCRHGGDEGLFQNEPRGACARTGLASGARFISNVEGQANYDPAMSLADVLGCLTTLGDSGCGFAHPLGSALRALGADGAPAPVENAGFLRPSAYLAVILVTDEDDCSAPQDSDLFDPTSRFVSDPLGPLTSYRCNEFGHLCGGTKPPRTMAATLTSCASAEDGRLLRVADVVSALNALKSDANMILAGAITGPPMPYVVQLTSPALSGDPSPWPAIAPSCAVAGGEHAAPAVRIEQWVYAFGHNGAFETICGDGFSAPLQEIARTIGGVLGPPCLVGDIASTVTAHGARPDCTVVDHAVGDGGAPFDTPIPACADSGDVAPCWTLARAAACPSGKLLTFRAQPGAPATTGAHSSVQCYTCTDPNDSRCATGP
jgi:hypothetical protein